MAAVTQLLDAAADGDPSAAAALLPLVYAELRTLAAARLVAGRPAPLASSFAGDVANRGDLWLAGIKDRFSIVVR